MICLFFSEVTCTGQIQQKPSRIHVCNENKSLHITVSHKSSGQGRVHLTITYMSGPFFCKHTTQGQKEKVIHNTYIFIILLFSNYIETPRLGTLFVFFCNFADIIMSAAMIGEISGNIFFFLTLLFPPLCVPERRQG